MGKIIGSIGKILLSPFAAGIGALSHKKPAAVPQPIPQPDDAAAAIAADDELRRRKGAAADIITGTRGAEALPTAGRLVRGN
jgi:hypothetical protein